MSSEQPKKSSSFDKTAEDFFLKLAKTIAKSDPAADKAFEASEARREAKMKAIIAARKARLAKKKGGG